MKILAIYPKLDLARPVGMDRNRLLLVEWLSQDHDVDVWVTANGPAPAETDLLEKLGATVLHSNPARVGQSALLAQSLLAEHVPGDGALLGDIPRRRLMEEYDIVHVETAGLAPLVACFTDTPVVWSLVDSPSYRKERLYRYNSGTVAGVTQFLEWKVAERLETRYSPYADAVHVVSETEARYLKDRYDVRTRAIPVALPTEFTDRPQGDSGENRVAVLGNQDVPYIRDGIAEYVFPAVRDLSKEVEDLHVVLLGRGRMDIPERYADIVHQPGWVESYADEVAQAAVAVVPDPVGSGIKNRTVQSLALGRPVVGTEYAFEGLDVEPETVGREVGSPAEVSAGLAELLADPSLRVELGERGRAFATERFNLEAVARSWNSLYELVIA